MSGSRQATSGSFRGLSSLISGTVFECRRSCLESAIICKITRVTEVIPAR